MRLIDADALHAKIYEDSERNYGAEANIAQVLLRIETAPTIESEVRHGRWIPIDGEPFAKCSYCGEKHYGCTTPYCDMCGARMDGGADNG